MLWGHYPIKAYKLREIVNKYKFIKTKSLDPFVDEPDFYIPALSKYEVAFIAHQFQLECILRSLAFRLSKTTWLRLRIHFWKMRKNVPEGDIVFYQQVAEKKRKSGQAAEHSPPPATENAV